MIGTGPRRTGTSPDDYRICSSIQNEKNGGKVEKIKYGKITTKN